MNNLYEYTVEPEFDNLRLDKYLSYAYPDKSRNFFQKLLKNNDVSVNGNPEKASYRVSVGDEISVTIPKDEEIEIVAENIPLDILYEDEDILVVNKPKGMVVHPAPGHLNGTLVNAIMYHCKDDLSGINGKIRPGIVHRIDMDTTGSLIVCKNDFSHNIIAEQIKNHTVNRIYYGFVAGNVKDDKGRIETTIGRHPTDRKKMAVNVKGGRSAITHYKVIERFKSGVSTFIEFKLETGRTHQIRVHMASLNHPLLGDSVYGSGKNPYHLKGQALHAGVIGFNHPRSGEYIEVAAPMPEYFDTLFKRFR